MDDPESRRGIPIRQPQRQRQAFFRPIAFLARKGPHDAASGRAAPGRMRRGEVFGLPIMTAWDFSHPAASFPPSPPLARRLADGNSFIGYRSATVPGSHRIPCTPHQVIAGRTTDPPRRGKPITEPVDHMAASTTGRSAFSAKALALFAGNCHNQPIGPEHET